MLTNFMMASRTLSVTVNCSAEKAYKLASDPANLPKWAKGLCKSAKRFGDGWVIETPQGPAGFRFAEKNAFGVLDHYVTSNGAEVFVPMRVVPNGGTSEVTLTIFQQPDMSDESFEKDINLVKQDLENLKNFIESGAFD